MGDSDALGADIVFVLLIFFVIFAICLAIYIAVGIFLNKFNKLLYGQGNPLAFIPVGNIYLLGKLSFNKAIGYILIGLNFCLPVSRVVISLSGDHGEVIAAFLSLLSSTSSMLSLVCLVVAIVKYNNIKKGFLSASEVAYQSNQTNLQEAFKNINPNRNNIYNNQPYNNIPNSNMQYNNVPNQNINNYDNTNNQMNNSNNPNVCPSCGSTITETTKFCTHCGTKIRD